MKKSFLIILSIVLITGCKTGKVVTLSFSNPMNIPRENEVVNLSYDEFKSLAADFEEGMLPLFISGDDTLTAQFINKEGDNLPENILLEISLDASENKAVKVIWTEEKHYPDFSKKTNIHFARLNNPGIELEMEKRIQSIKTEETSKIFQMEGPAWENDKVGFRNYFDLRNGMDIFGKLTDDLVLMNAGLHENAPEKAPYNFNISYHEPSDWGMDILKVGNSLGAGAIALEINDSLYRIGDNGHGTYNLICSGPLKSELRFDFPDWNAGDVQESITQNVSITAGEYCYEATLLLNSNDQTGSFVTGIVNKHSDQLIRFDAGENHTVFMTFDKQAEDGSMLAMAICIKKEDLASFGETRETGEGITETYYVGLNTTTGIPVSYRFYAFWERSDPSFTDVEKIKERIKLDMIRKENPMWIKRN